MIQPGIKQKIRNVRPHLTSLVLWLFGISCAWVVVAAFPCSCLSPMNAAVEGKEGMPTLVPGELCDGKGQCTPALMYEGYVTSDFEHRFKGLINQLPEAERNRYAWLCFNSNGGSTMKATDVSVQIHKGALNTCAVPIQIDDTHQRNTQCASACAGLFLAGRQRVVGSGARIGLHSSSTGNHSKWCWAPNFASWMAQAFLFQPWYRYFADDSSDMRKTSDMVALNTPADQIHWITAEELRQWKVVSKEQTFAGWFWRNTAASSLSTEIVLSKRSP